MTAMQRESKLKKACSPQELADILRALAQSLEHGAVAEGILETTWDRLEKLTLTVRSVDPETMEVKLKVASRSPVAMDPAQIDSDTVRVEEISPRPRGKYDTLKKRMKKTFKNIMYALHDRVWPDIRDVETFVHDSALMIRYPDKGAEFYAEYAQAVADFHVAVSEQNMDAAIEKVHLLNDLKTRCHKLYD